ncbi:MAG TPA: hypothetical protein VK864_18415 [Longimicrobiales bacterium]|nr:hypothetical protein [Longimicrobiales bacterium]
MWKHLTAGLALLLASACGADRPEPRQQTLTTSALPCDTPRVTGRLPMDLHEASGVTAGPGDPGTLWVLVDDGPPVLFALDSTGSVRRQVTVRNAGNRDWESLTAARCATGNCLYIGDIGDNQRRRESIRIYRLPEPSAETTTTTADLFEFRYPDGRHDAEALFILPGEQVHIVTKGRHGPITVYRYTGPLVSGQVLQLEAVQQLSTSMVQLPDMITGGGATLDGGWVALRTYSSVQLFRSVDGKLMPELPGNGISLEVLREFQGEGVDLDSSGTIVLVSEQGLDDGAPPLSRVNCRLRS